MWTALTSLGKSTELLKLPGDDPGLAELQRRLKLDERALDDLGDGIKATRLISDFHGIWGLGKIDGYSKLIQRLRDHFEVTPSGIHDAVPGNFFEFPYDWRHDNRVAALRLQQLVNRHLPRWRQSSGANDAKVILIGHSMGGLVSRYYLEVLEGWRDCRALITFGTPYRGSVNAVNFMANGYKKLFVDLTELMRSLPSAYQLLPIYEMLQVGDDYQRVAETDGVPGVVKERAAQALAFHREIENAVNTHLNDPDYRHKGYTIIPIVGSRQITLQSARLAGGTVTVSQEVPAWIDARLQDGDGTVPRLSAIPIELSEAYRDTYFPERHASLQNNEHVLDDLCERLTQMQISGLAGIKGFKTEPPGISLEVDDLFLPEEPVTLRAKLVGKELGPLTVPIQARIEPVGGAANTLEANFKEINDGWELTIPECAAGLYRVEVRLSQDYPGMPSPVHDLFEVVR